MSEIKLFESQKIRSEWVEAENKRYFSVIDIVAVLTGSSIPRRYWSDLKKKLINEGSEVYEKIVQLKLEADDGKKYATDCADTESLLRIIQTIPSPKAELFKVWLAKVGYERIQEISDPEMSLDRARENWSNMGRSQKWIQQRMMGQETRNKLTDYWQNNGVETPKDFALLTSIIHKEWSGVTVKQHKEIKHLKTQNLRDHMSEAELIFTALAELSTRQVAETDQAHGVSENIKAGKKGGSIAKRARLDFEEQTGQKVVTGENFLVIDEKKKIEDK